MEGEVAAAAAAAGTVVVVVGGDGTVVVVGGGGGGIGRAVFVFARGRLPIAGEKLLKSWKGKMKMNSKVYQKKKMNSMMKMTRMTMRMKMVVRYHVFSSCPHDSS